MNQQSAAPQSALIDTYEQFPIAICRAEGSRLYTEDGRSYWDFYGGHAVALLGHSDSAVADAISEQARTLAFYSNVLDLPIRRQAAEALVRFAGGSMSSAFFCNSGAEANENALKLAIQQTGRVRIAALDGAFHGRTLLALAATAGPKLHAGIEPLLCDVVRIRPNAIDDLAGIDETVAALIVEPILSIAGMIELSEPFLRAARDRCTRIGAKLVYDEVQTGMGRLGCPMAAGRFDVWPDMLTLAKGLANGVPAGAVLMNADTASKVKIGDLGSTFGGGPIACAAMLAVLKQLDSRRLVTAAARLGDAMHSRLRVGPVEEVLGRGCLLGLRVEGTTAKALQSELLSRGFVTGTSGNPQVLRLMPPLSLPMEAVEELAGVLSAWKRKTNEALACTA